MSVISVRQEMDVSSFNYVNQEKFYDEQFEPIDRHFLIDTMELVESQIAVPNHLLQTSMSNFNICLFCYSEIV